MDRDVKEWAAGFFRHFWFGTCVLLFFESVLLAAGCPSWLAFVFVTVGSVVVAVSYREDV